MGHFADGMVKRGKQLHAAWEAMRDARSLQMPFTILLARALGLSLTMLMSTGPGGPAPPLRLREV